MRKSKLKRFAELDTFTNVLQNFNFLQPVVVNHEKQIVDPKGKWHSTIFKNNNPIILELACGKGEYTCEMALADKNSNYIKDNKYIVKDMVVSGDGDSITNNILIKKNDDGV